MNRSPEEQAEFEEKILRQVNLELLKLAMTDTIYQNYTSPQFPGRIFQGNIYRIMLELWNEANMDNVVRQYIHEAMNIFYYFEDIPQIVFQDIIKVVVYTFKNQYSFVEIPFEYSTVKEPKQKRERDEDDFEIFYEAPMKTESNPKQIRIGSKLYNENITRLDFSDKNLSKIPEEVWEFRYLEELVLAVNRITTISKKIKNLTKLKFLDIADNKIKTLPDEIWGLTNLEELSMSGNQMTVIPRKIGNLPRLKSLDISYNQLKNFEIGGLIAIKSIELAGNQLKNISEEIGNMRSLEILDLSENRLTTLPSQIGKLYNLEILKLVKNRLKILPPEIGNLSALKNLEMGENELRLLPPEIGNLKSLTSLDISDNKLTAVPRTIGRLSALEVLDLRSNRLTSLPDDIAGLISLTILDVDDNELTTLPRGLLAIPNLHNVNVRNNKINNNTQNIILSSLPKIQFNFPRRSSVDSRGSV